MNFVDWVQLITGPLILLGVLMLIRAQGKTLKAFRDELAAVRAQGEAELAAVRAAGCGCWHGPGREEVPW